MIMNIKYLVVREKVQELQISIVHIAVENMTVDSMTQGLASWCSRRTCGWFIVLMYLVSGTGSNVIFTFV